AGPKKRFRRTADGTGTEFEVIDATPFDEDAMVPLEAAKGTLVLLHGLLPHRSSTNTSPQSRHAYSVHVIDAEAKYANDNWLQRGDDMPLRGFAGATSIGARCALPLSGSRSRRTRRTPGCALARPR